MDDLIDRQAAIEKIHWLGLDNDTTIKCDLAIRALSSVNTQEPKTGHWIKDDITERSKSAYKHKCDRCGAYHRAMYDYCPSCGTRMESEG